MNPPASKRVGRDTSESHPMTPYSRALNTLQQRAQDTDRVTRSSSTESTKGQGNDIASDNVCTGPENARISPRPPKRKAEELEKDIAEPKAADSAAGNGPFLFLKHWPSPPKKQKPSPQSGHRKLPTPHEQDCGHGNHPAYSDYKQPRCPTCRVTDAMSDVRRAQDMIITEGGVSQLRKLNRERYWELHEGGRQKRRRNGVIEWHRVVDINGNDSSYRSAKVRLLNLVIELEVLSSMEQDYEKRQKRRSSSKKKGTAHKTYSAANALSLYYAAAAEGRWKKLEDAETLVMRERAWTFQQLYQTKEGLPAYIQTAAEHKSWEEYVHNKIHADSPASQSARAGPSPASRTRPELRARKKPAATVRFDRYAYQRKESNVDELRWATNSCSVEFLEDSIPTVVPVSILRTANRAYAEGETRGVESQEQKTEDGAKTSKISSAPKPESVMHLTKEGDGSLRISGTWHRPKPWYVPGKWATFGDNELVDTSGSSFKDVNAWDAYVADLHEEADAMDESEDETDAESSSLHADRNTANGLQSPTRTVDFADAKPLARPEAEAQQQELRPRLEGLRSALKKTGAMSSLGAVVQTYRPL